MGDRAAIIAAAQAMRTAIFPLDRGSASICAPVDMTQEDIETLRKYLDVWLGVESRKSTLRAEHAPVAPYPGPTPSLGTHPGNPLLTPGGQS